MIKDIIKDGFCDLFTPEEWDLWIKGEFNLFDNYVERVGMSKEDANRLRARFEQPAKNSLTNNQIKSIIKDNERNNT